MDLMGKNNEKQAYWLLIRSSILNSLRKNVFSSKQELPNALKFSPYVVYLRFKTIFF